MVNVIKASGEKEVFDEKKLLSSIQRAHVPEHMHLPVLSHVKSHLHPDIPTSEIHHHISEFLAQSPYPYTKGRYSLKQALMALGPAGYVFEEFIAAIFREQGYTTVVDSIVPGNCITHEVDVIAEKNGGTEKKRLMVEAKFHNSSGIRTDVHVALYTKARFDDIKTQNHIDEVWLVTNTKVTLDVINYGLCSNLRIMSWSYPQQHSLRDIVEREGLLPVTALTTLSALQLQQLLEAHVLLCKELLQKEEYLTPLALSDKEREMVLAECRMLTEKIQKQTPNI